MRPGIAFVLCFFFLSTLYEHGALAGELLTCSGIVPTRTRRNVITITQFGGVGDGKTLNTGAFKEAIYWIHHLKRRGGTMLYIPKGVWLTGSFNLTSHMTLYLARGAVIKATQDTSKWPLVDPLPSYGRGRERPGGRYMSFINAFGVHDVVITGDNGTIDGQGSVWWDMWRRRSLKFTRPNLLEFMYSKNIIISNVAFRNSPFWNIHPVYSSNVVIRHVTILAPFDSPNTDGIDPDSSYNVCIEDSYIATGDDLVAIKSGWDEYGIAYNRPSYDITIRRIHGTTPFAGIAIGSETSGGVQNVLAEQLNFFNVGVGIHIKTNTGRGGVVSNVTFFDVNLYNAGQGIRIAGDVGDHPDNRFNPKALPTIEDITFRNIWGDWIEQPGSIQGIKGFHFTKICLYNVQLRGFGSTWKCGDESDAELRVNSWPCPEITSAQGSGFCYTAT